MTFKMVMGLWLTPDYSEVEAGRREPPRLNHSKVDFEALARFYKDLFPYGPPVKIQVPDDTIDQVTIHMRQIPGSDPESLRCSDFGAVLLAQAAKQKSTVVNMRSGWSNLHYLKDRDFAPPPTLLPFVVSASDFEDAMIWQSSCRPSLGLPPFGILDESGRNQEHEGTLSQEFRNRLEQIFGSPFEPLALLDRMASGPVPAYVRR